MCLSVSQEKLSTRAEEAEALARTRLTESFGGDAESGARLLQAESRAEEADQEIAELQAQLEATEAVVRAVSPPRPPPPPLRSPPRWPGHDISRGRRCRVRSKWNERSCSRTGRATRWRYRLSWRARTGWPRS